MSKAALMSLAVLVLIAGQASAAIRLLDSDFGFGLYPADWFGFQYRPPMKLRRFRLDPLIDLSEKEDEADTAGFYVGKDGFQASLDVRGFKPNEITVRTVDNTVVVEAKHEEREDNHGFIARQFVRKYSLPYGYDPKEVVSTLSSDGVLTVKAPAPPESDATQKERVVQIQQTGPAVDNVKDTPPSEDATTTDQLAGEKENAV